MSCTKENKGHVFSRPETTFLIEVYQQYPLLYQTSHGMYKRKTKRLLAVRKITDEFNNNFPFANITEEDIGKKINSLRTQYFSEVNKIKKSELSGAGIDDVYISNLWCFDLLKFLDSGNVVRASESTLRLPNNVDEYDDDSTEVVFEGTVNELNQIDSPLNSPTLSGPSTSRGTSISREGSIEPSMSRGQSRKRQRQSSVSSNATNLIEKATSLLENSAPESGDVIDAFATSIAAELREIRDARTCRLLRKKILDLIYETNQ